MSEIIPLFPLSTVLFPHGRIGLQVFEPRYLDLVSSCLKYNNGFGVVLLREGGESLRAGHENEVRLSQVGTMAKVVDWDSLPNGLLGITIEGEEKFRIISSYREKNGLNKASVEWIDPEPVIDLPENSGEMKGLLEQLLEHPHLSRLKQSMAVNDVSTLSCLLTQLLPIDEKIKFTLLALSDPTERLQQLMDILDNLSQ